MAHRNDQKIASGHIRDTMTSSIERAQELARPVPESKDENLMLA